jgi:hypothetical protein
METKPEGKGISIVETDLSVDFAPPVGYVEPEKPKSYAVRVRVLLLLLCFLWTKSDRRRGRTKPKSLFRSTLFVKSQILLKPLMGMELVYQGKPRLHFSESGYC